MTRRRPPDAPAPGHRRRRVHRQRARPPDPGASTTARAITVLDKLTYAGNRANLAAVATTTPAAPTLRVRPGRHRRPGRSSSRSSRDRDAIVNFAAESHVDRSSSTRGLPAHRASSASTCCSRPCAASRSRRPRRRPSRFLQVSTDEVYGDVARGPIRRDRRRSPPRSPYAAAKAAGELLVRALPRDVRRSTPSSRAARTRTARTSTPRSSSRCSSPTPSHDQPLPMYGDGMQVRDWLHVDDHAAAIDVRARPRRAGRGLQRRRASTELPNREVIGRLLAATGQAAGRSSGACPTGPGHDRRYAMDGVEARGARLDAAGRVRRRACPRPSTGSRERAVVAAARSRATGTPTTSASTGTGCRGGPRPAALRPADRCGSRSPAPAAGWAGR